MPDRSALKRAIQMNIFSAEDPEPRVGLHKWEDLVELQVIGSATRHEDFEAEPTCNIPLLDVLALLMMQKPASRAAILKAIRDAAKDSQKDPKKRGISEFLEITKKAKREVEDEIIAKMPKKLVRGKFTSEVNVEVLTSTPLEVAMKD